MNITPSRASATEPAIYLDGTAVPKTYDFANGPDEAPQPKFYRLPPWPGVVAHSRADEGLFYIFDQRAYGPEEPVDLRCGSCRADSTVVIDELRQRLVFVVGHGRGCRAVEDQLAVAGLA